MHVRVCVSAALLNHNGNGDLNPDALFNVSLGEFHYNTFKYTEEGRGWGERMQMGNGYW